MVLNLRYISENCWHEVCKKVKGAAVFVDKASAECLSWHGGVALLWKHGASCIREFSSFESGGDIEKGVFLVSSPVVGPARIVLRDLISNSKFNHCILITSCSPVVLNVATTGNVPENAHEMTAVHKLELDMLRWMKDKNYTAEIFHFPISIVPVTDYFFTTPPFSDFMPCFSEDLEGKTIYSSLPRNLDLEALPLELQIGVLHLMTTINSLLSQLSVRESIYCIGLLSSLVGSSLQKHTPSALRLKTASSNMSLVLIDRTLDLCDAMYQNNQVLLDKMKSILEPFPGHSIDVAIDMSPICKTKMKANTGWVNAPGCLHDPKTDLFEWLIMKKQVETITELYERLYAECQLDFPKRLDTKQLLKTISENFKDNLKDKIIPNSGLIQVSLGVIETLNSNEINSLEVVESLKKLLYQSISADNSTDNALIQLKEIMVMRKKRGLTVEKVLSLIVFFYSLVGQQFTIQASLAEDLQEVVANAIEKDKENIGSLSAHFESFEKAKVREFTRNFFTKLNSIRNARKHFTKYNEIAANHGRSQPLEYRSLISQLMYDIVDSNKPEMPDLKYKANMSMKDNFTSRFSSMILNVAKPHVMDNDIIMIYVIGGVTAQEVKYIKDCFKGCNKEVIIGSTTLSSPSQTLQNLFFKDPLKPFEI
ncbi:sec1 family domain-containing protein 2-like [Cimex lectularius]|uniref:Sec1 family domain-containing protein 2 n=1 Tax=Cimex lectularius TaxID=79782 RepID=A0A8I6TCR5_CIMLE|nr:sec1 family domain-containing protein 2-like [Cimex lectularius]XP_014239831.1 sec1 family domain-containing protein 2-like [Cimex lectularius]XP_014239832.1 sec1 family domain-containing protein 2-like [Cimex lectularius]XP_014239833.1 sec1 family domain-containing protein 2-like [Cimex lectularius]